MKKIFIIYSNPSDYEECKYAIGYTASEDEAKDVVEDLKDEYLKARVFNDCLHESYREFKKENPSPLMSQNIIEIPRWPSGISQNAITQEMRQERNDIIEKNKKTSEEHSKVYAEWQVKQIEYVKPLIKSVEEEPWFKKWFKIGEQFINCSAYRLVEGQEFFYESCEELK